MQAFLISQLLQVLMKELSKHAPDLLRKFMDAILDWLEEHVLGTASEADDAIVLPICNMIRDTFNIPDND